jgi:hypothetical protein
MLFVIVKCCVLFEVRTEILTAIEKDFMEKVWQELDYRLDVCRVTRGLRFKTLRNRLRLMHIV